ELVGEQALLAPGAGRRNATLTAATALTLLALSKGAFDALAPRHPSLRTAIEVHADELSTDRFIAFVGPFMNLDADVRRALARRVVKHAFEPGQALMHQGDTSDSCYMLRSGTVEVVLEATEGT